MNKYTVGIIGAGSIGALKPNHIDSPETAIPLTHAHAIYNDERFDLAWISDIDQEKETSACNKWEIKEKPYDPDIVVIASPTNTHLEKIESLCDDRMYSKGEQKPKLIILEKPAGMNIHECTKIDYLTKQAGIPVIINYGRRFCPSIMNAISLIKEENIQQIVCYYTRGLIRDGSHAIDMINQFFVSMGINIPSTWNEPLCDYDKSDPTYELVMNPASNIKARLIPLDGRLYDIFEMHVFTEQARWIFDDHFKVITRQQKEQESTYGDYASMPGILNLTYHGRKKTTDLEWSLKYLYDDVYKKLEDKSHKPACTIKDALRVHAVLDKAFINLKMKENK